MRCRTAGNMAASKLWQYAAEARDYRGDEQDSLGKAEESVKRLVAFFSKAAAAVQEDVTHIDALLESVLVDEKEIILPPQVLPPAGGAGPGVEADDEFVGAVFHIVNGVMVPVQVVNEKLTDVERDRNEVAACVRCAYYAQKVADVVTAANDHSHSHGKSNSSDEWETYSALLARQRRKVQVVRGARRHRYMTPWVFPQGLLQMHQQAPAAEVPGEAEEPRDRAQRETGSDQRIERLARKHEKDLRRDRERIEGDKRQICRRAPHARRQRRRQADLRRRPDSGKRIRTRLHCGRIREAH